MPRDLFADPPNTQPKDLFAQGPQGPQGPAVNFAKAFEEYRSGQMDPAKVPAFEELLRRNMPQITYTGNQEPSIGERTSQLGGALVQGAKNLPGSVWDLAKGTAEALLSPIDTAAGLINLGAGAFSKMAGEHPSKMPEDRERQELWETVADDFVSKYESFDNFTEAIANKPAEVLSDLAAVLTLGGSTLSQVPRTSKVGQILTDAGKAVDPLQLAARTTGAVTKPVTQALATGVEEGLGITTGVGSNTIKEAKKTPRSVFDTVREKFTKEAPVGAGFEQARKGKISVSEIANRAKNAVLEVKDQRNQAFLDNIAPLEKANIPVVMDDITNALIKSMDELKIQPKATQRGKGLDLDYSRVSINAADQNKAKNIIERVLAHGNRAEDLTPKGLLELRDDLATVSTKNPKIQQLIDNITSSIDDTLNEFPGYQKLREEADTFNALIKEFEGTLGIDPSKSGHEVIKKLVQVGDDNVGLRRRLLSELETMSGTSLAQEIAGLEMRSTLPKAMVSRAAGGAIIYGGIMSNMPLLASLASVSSPRLMGKLLYQYGYSRNTVKQVVEALEKAGAFDPKVTTSAAIAGRAVEEEEE